MEIGLPNSSTCRRTRRFRPRRRSFGIDPACRPAKNQSGFHYRCPVRFGSPPRRAGNAFPSSLRNLVRPHQSHSKGTSLCRGRERVLQPSRLQISRIRRNLGGNSSSGIFGLWPPCERLDVASDKKCGSLTNRSVLSAKIGSRLPASSAVIDFAGQSQTSRSDASGGDIVMDFFTGSCTTAHAVMQLNKEDGVSCVLIFSPKLRRKNP